MKIKFNISKKGEEGIGFKDKYFIVSIVLTAISVISINSLISFISGFNNVIFMVVSGIVFGIVLLPKIYNLTRKISGSKVRGKDQIIEIIK